MNDVHFFDLETYSWVKIDVSGVSPSPRSGCQMTVFQDQSKVVIYGGYSKEKVSKDVDKGKVHTDMFTLGPDGTSTHWVTTPSLCSLCLHFASSHIYLICEVIYEVILYLLQR